MQVFKSELVIQESVKTAHFTDSESSILTKSAPYIRDGNPSMSVAFMTGMKLSRRGRPKLETPKVELKIRRDAKTVEHLRASGPGWQTRINAVLGKLAATAQI